MINLYLILCATFPVLAIIQYLTVNFILWNITPKKLWARNYLIFNKNHKPKKYNLHPMLLICSTAIFMSTLYTTHLPHNIYLQILAIGILVISYPSTNSTIISICTIAITTITGYTDTYIHNISTAAYIISFTFIVLALFQYCKYLFMYIKSFLLIKDNN